MTDDVKVAIIGTIGTVAVALITTYGTKLLFKNKKAKEKKTPLSEHIFHVNIFDYINQINSCLNSLDITGRKLLAIDFLDNYYRCWDVACKEFSEKIDKLNKNNSNNRELFEYATELFNKGIEYENVNYTSQLEQEDKIAVYIFRDKFKEWNTFNISRLKIKLKDICLLDYYPTNYLKGVRILEEINDFLCETINEVNYLICKINGDLTNRFYKGKIL